MSITNFPNGVSSFGVPVVSSGPIGPGKLFHLVVAGSNYHLDLVDRAVENVFTSLSSLHSSMRSGYGDTCLVYPGNHIQTSGLTWTKSDCRLIAVGSPNQLMGTTTPVAGSVVISCVTAAVSYILKITAHHFSMYGIQTTNTAANTGNNCDIMIGAGSRNPLFVNCGFRGGNNTTQTQNATAGIPVWIAAEATAGNGAKFKECWIGSSGNVARTKGPGCLYFASGAAKGLNFEFENCRFTSRNEVQNADKSCLIHLAGNNAADRYMFFKDCLLYNFWANHTNKLDFAVVDDCGTTKDIVFHNCALIGVDAYANQQIGTDSIWTTVANGASDGGKGVAVDVAA